jgi:hypothetical protein
VKSNQTTLRARPGRPSPALVISIIALFVALGGTGYAINTIDSSDVINNSLTSKDVKNRSLHRKDVKPNTLGGGQINEASLAKVPSAATADSAATAGSANTATTAGSAATAGDAGLLDGIDSLGFARVRSVSSSSFLEGNGLELSVPGYGAYHLLCNDNNTPAVANDDSIAFFQQPHMQGAILGGAIQASNLGTGVVEEEQVIGGVYTGGGGTQYGTSGERLSVTFHAAAPGSEKAIVVHASGHEDNTSAACRGQIQAFLFGS